MQIMKFNITGWLEFSILNCQCFSFLSIIFRLYYEFHNANGPLKFRNEIGWREEKNSQSKSFHLEQKL